MPLVETGPGYISPSSGGYSAPGAAPAPAAPAPTFPTPIPQDTFTGGYGPLPAQANPIAPQSTPVQGKSFFSNLWDQFIGPVVKGIWNFISGLFGKGAATLPASIPTR